MPLASPRAAGLAIVAAMFVVATVESRFALRLDSVLPLWDKPVHAMTAIGLVLIASPRRERRLGCFFAVLVLSIGWEIAQFLIVPFAATTPEAWLTDTTADLGADIIGAALALRSKLWTRASRVTCVDPLPAVRTP